MHHGLTGLTLLLAIGGIASAEPPQWQRDIKPILQARCVACHGPLKQESGLRLDAASLALRGGESGAVIKPNDAAGSLVLRRVSAADPRERMPPEGEPLKPEQIELLKEWIAGGAKAPAGEEVVDPAKHWAFQPLKKPRLRELQGRADLRASARRNTIDAFIDAEHDRLGLQPLPAADKATLLRRVYLDLVGVTPSREELYDFLADERPDAYEQVVERLLASPLHAQRWARHWMDIWRYSDWYGSRGGNELRNSRRHIWRWRDWVIDSVAADKPYDRMILEMLAGDELAPGDDDVLRATGYLGRNYYVFNRHVWLHDTVEFTSTAFLGLTMKCCRCHDHKYDPLAQEEYFRLRAFFEPLNVRTDQLPGKSEVITGNWPMGAPPGATLKDGRDVVYDSDLTAPTYLLARGNEKNPVTDKPLAPGVPAILGKPELDVAAVQLPLEVFYPDLRPQRRQELIDQASAGIAQAEAGLTKARTALRDAQERIETASQAAANTARPKPFLQEDFAREKKEVWKVHSGEWEFADGRLKLKRPGVFSTVTALANHPRNFKATLKYRTLPGGSFGSIGVFFDSVELKDAQAVYTHVNANSSGVQAFHRQNGQEHYPPAAIVKSPLKLSEETTLEITAHEQELKIWLNGELKLTYAMPLPRRDGQFAIWGHEAAGEFLSLTIEPLVATVDDLKRELPTLVHEVRAAELLIQQAKASADSVRARIAAEVAKHESGGDEANKLALAKAASKSERQTTVAKAQLELLTAQRQLEAAQAAAKAQDAKAQEAVTTAMTQVTAMQTALQTAEANAAKDDTTYQPLGPVYPNTSSGRRLALARWIASPDNPLTARVAVNHVWRRHFGSALVPSVANFGLNGKPPTHPALLDYLATEFINSGWSQRHLHRLIVTSAAYQRASSEGTASQLTAANTPLDRDNKYLWRANVKRMESELIRDSLLALSGDLDCAAGGPELDPAVGDTSNRRSLYFRITPDDQALMLELFDGAAPAECFERTESIVPQQALALANGPISATQARRVARQLSAGLLKDTDFVQAAFEQVLSRLPDERELASCEKFLASQAVTLADPARLTRRNGTNNSLAPSTDPKLRARENLVHVLINHPDFVTIR